MNIRPSAAIRQNYNEIAELCRKSAAPVYLTKNVEGDLYQMRVDEEIYTSLEVGMRGVLTILEGRLDSFVLDEE